MPSHFKLSRVVGESTRGLRLRSMGLSVLAAFAIAAFADGAAAQAPSCNVSPTPDCLYFPATEYAIGTEPPEVLRETVYKDAGGMLRRVKMALRIPKDAPLPLPVVIWSHGGAEGKVEPDGVLVEWSRATARAGYLTVTIAHPPRARPSRELLCAAEPLLIDPVSCEQFKHLHWDRPHDIGAVLNELERMSAMDEFRGLMDLAHIAVAGHSSGSSGALSVGGALRKFTGQVLDMSDPRPVAFLAFSPQGPGSEGFFDTDFKHPEHSWRNIDRPVLVGTGDGDSTCNPLPEPGSCFGDSPFIRRIGYERMPSGGKYQVYLQDPEIFHTLFELRTSKCSEKGVTQSKCDETARWLTSSALAFLDAHLRGNGSAAAWLASDNLVDASQGVARWLRK